MFSCTYNRKSELYKSNIRIYDIKKVHQLVIFPIHEILIHENLYIYNICVMCVYYNILYSHESTMFKNCFKILKVLNII